MSIGQGKLLTKKNNQGISLKHMAHNYLVNYNIEILCFKMSRVTWTFVKKDQIASDFNGFEAFR